MRLLACPDKFRGTASAPVVAAAVAAAGRAHGCEVEEQPMADGGEGTLDAFGGPTHNSTVTGPLGEPVDAAWRLARRFAVIEMAHASGLELVGGADGNDALAATSRGTGELIDAAIRAGATEIVIGLGGSATTDGGLGAVEALQPHARLRGIDLRVAADVRTRFVDAARMFGPQKGASEPTVDLLERRLRQLAGQYERDFGIDVSAIERSGAAGGLAGGLAALGASLEDGFELIADAVELDRQIENVDLVVTGEGSLDLTTWEGKVVGGVLDLALAANVPVLVVAGQIHDDPPAGIEVVDLSARYGMDKAMTRTTECVETAVSDFLSS